MDRPGTTIADVAADLHSRIVTLSDGRTAGVAEYGDPAGLPVLALHGAPACRMMFAVADAAARRHGLRLIAPDRPGYGLSPVDRDGTLVSRTDFHARVAEALGLDRFAVLAISGGAPYAVALAAKFGARVSALALVSPMGPVADTLATTGGQYGGVPFLQRRFFLHLPRRWLFPPLAQLAARLFMVLPRGFGGGLAKVSGDPDARILARPEVREAMIAMTREAVRGGAHGGIADLCIYGRPWGIDVAAVSAPAILWQGSADRVVPVAAALHLARLLPRCRLVQLQGAGHFWVFEHLDEVCVALRQLVLDER
ncbi:MAG: alpha/beta fold hydrolase [Hyphomicrobium sp.]